MFMLNDFECDQRNDTITRTPEKHGASQVSCCKLKAAKWRQHNRYITLMALFKVVIKNYFNVIDFVAFSYIVETMQMYKLPLFLLDFCKTVNTVHKSFFFFTHCFAHFNPNNWKQTSLHIDHTDWSYWLSVIFLCILSAVKIVIMWEWECISTIVSKLKLNFVSWIQCFFSIIGVCFLSLISNKKTHTHQYYKVLHSLFH